MLQVSEVLKLVIDESSMESLALYGVVNQQTQALTGRSDIPMGGISVIQAGDFQQLPPTDGLGLWTRFDRLKSPALQNARNLWVSQSQIVHSLQSNRRSEATWAATLEILRTHPTKEFLEALNKELIVTVLRPLNPNARLIIAHNKTRIKIALAMFKARCAKAYANKPQSETNWRIQGALLAQMQITSKASKGKVVKRGPLFNLIMNKLTEEELSKSQGPTPWLGLIIGEEYVLAARVGSTRNGLVKNMWVRLVDIVFTSDDPPMTWDPVHKYHTVGVQNIKYVLVKLLMGSFANRALSEGMPVGVAAYEPQTCSFTHKWATGKEEQASLLQLPMRSAKVNTPFKVQGMGMEYVGVDYRAGVDREWLYVALSRATRRENVFLLAPVPTDPLKFVPSLEKRIELARLRLNHLETRLRFFAETGCGGIYCANDNQLQAHIVHLRSEIVGAVTKFRRLDLEQQAVDQEASTNPKSKKRPKGPTGVREGQVGAPAKGISKKRKPNESANDSVGADSEARGRRRGRQSASEDDARSTLEVPIVADVTRLSSGEHIPERRGKKITRGT